MTFPRCEKSREDALEALHHLPTVRPLLRAVVAREEHQDGTPHLHVLAVFGGVIDTTRPDFFDPVGGQHGNYQKTKNERDWYNYVTKADKAFVTFGEFVFTESGRKATVSDEVALSLKDGVSMRELVRERPGFVLRHQRLIREFTVLLSSFKEQESLVPWSLIRVDEVVHLQTRELCEWANSAIQKVLFTICSFKPGGSRARARRGGAAPPSRHLGLRRQQMVSTKS